MCNEGTGSLDTWRFLLAQEASLQPVRLPSMGSSADARKTRGVIWVRYARGEGKRLATLKWAEEHLGLGSF